MSDWILPLIIIAQLGLIIFQYVHWSKVTNKLIDKLMSRNYAEYSQAHAAQQPQVKIPVEPDLPEDLRALQDFRLI